MDKNTIVGFLLIALVLIGYSYYSSQQEPPQQPTAATQSETARTAGNIRTADQQAAQPAIDTTSLFAHHLKGSDRVITLQNSKIKVEVSSKGGTISRVELKEYKNQQKTNVVLFSEQTASLDFTLRGKERLFHTRDFYFTPVQVTDTSVVMQMTDSAGKAALMMKYALKPDNYMVDFSISSQGLYPHMDATAKTLGIEWNDRVAQQEKGFMFENQYSTLTYMQDDNESQKLSETETSEETTETPVRWVAFKNQYFSAILIGYDKFTDAHFKSHQETEGSGYLKSYSATMETPFDVNGKKATTFQFYFGPNQYRLLQHMDQYSADGSELGLENLVYLGWPIFKWINRYFTIYVFDWLSQLGLPMGIVLLLITLLLHIIVYIPRKRSYISSAKMRVLKPKVDEIAKKYPNPEDAMKRQQETMALYNMYGVSPMGGCLPMLVQMPIWVAMFNFVPNAIELRQQSFLWADDLSTYDDVISWSVNLPFIGNHLSLFCLLFCATNLIYTLMTMRMQRETMTQEQASQMKVMQWVMVLMPLFFFFMFNKYSAGLNYYYFISLLIGALCMWYLRKTTDEKKLLEKLEANYQANKNNPSRKVSGMAARLEALQKRQQEMLEEQKRRSRKQ